MSAKSQHGGKIRVYYLKYVHHSKVLLQSQENWKILLKYLPISTFPLSPLDFRPIISLKRLGSSHFSFMLWFVFAYL